jgi:uncharacterized membrane protein
VSDSSSPGFTSRHWIAFTALIGVLLATYLHLWKLGYMGALVCNAQHSCEAVMTSGYGQFLGVDVALIGAIGYTLILITAMTGIQPARMHDPRITRVLAFLIVVGFLFTLRLKYYEYIVMKLFCRWCFVSTVIITTQLIAVIMDGKRVGGRGSRVEPQSS